MELFFERVYTIDEWRAGPRAGVANFAGMPHFFRAVCPESDSWSPDEDRFELTPLSVDLFKLMLEADAIYHRWHPGPRLVGTGAEDGLGGGAEDRVRYAELERQIADALAERLPIGIARGQFDFDPDRVRWTLVSRAHPHRDVSHN